MNRQEKFQMIEKFVYSFYENTKNGGEPSEKLKADVTMFFMLVDNLKVLDDHNGNDICPISAAMIVVNEKFPGLCRRFTADVNIAKAVIPHGPTRPGYIDTLWTRWIMLRDETVIPKIVEICGRYDVIGQSARWSLDQNRKQFPELEEIIKRSGWAL